MEHAIGLITLILFTLLGLVLDFISFMDALFSSALTHLGVPLHAQAPLLIIACVLLAVAAFQLLGRLVAILLLVLFVLLLIHPHMPHGWEHHTSPPRLSIPGGPNITM